MYTVHSIQYTIQGEGFHAGRPAVFCRFAGCNLWSGLEADRGSADCKFCDTQFVGTDPCRGGGKFNTAHELASRIRDKWQLGGAQGGAPMVVFTGGEPSLQLTWQLIAEVRGLGFFAAVETNGTRQLPHGLDWICVSPKAGMPLKQATGNEIKLAFPQERLDPADYLGLSFDHFWIQPIDKRPGEPERDMNTKAAAEYCKRHPDWRLSLQTHKFAGLP